MKNIKNTFNKREERKEAKIPVSELKIGMFVSALDRDWLGTPFLLEGLYVQSQSDIDEIARYCKYVYILTSKPIDLGAKVDFDSGVLIGRKPTKYSLQSSMGVELNTASVIFSKKRELLKNFFSPSNRNAQIDYDEVSKVVCESVESVIRHPDAMAFLTRLRNQDAYTVEHSMNVCTLAIVFGRRLGLKKRPLINLGICALLHDVGKSRVPLEVLNKPGRLSDEEFEQIKKHADFGKDILSESDRILDEAVTVAYSHHEKVDGSGYPRKIENKEITLFTKIVSIVDTYDAITGDRVYAKGRPSAEAMRILYENRGSQFDEGLVPAFIQTVGIYPPGIIVELVNGSVAITLDSDGRPKHLPNILVVLDQNKKPIGNEFVELEKTVSGEVGSSFLIKSCLADGCYGLKLKNFMDKGVFESFNTANKHSR